MGRDYPTRRKPARLLVACLLFASSAAPLSQANAASGSFTNVRLATAPERLIASHNVERAMARVAPLRWDSGLAAQAASYARYLASSGLFRHSDRRLRPGTGENLWMGSHGYFSIEQMVSGWSSERRMFVAGTFPYVSRTRNWEDVGHYTQMVWPTTQRVGCGIGTGRGNDVLVCRYWPAGNVEGRPVGGWWTRQISSR